METEDIEVVELSVDFYTARKDYTCWDCGGTIDKGTEYVREVLLIDKEIRTYRHHRVYTMCLREEENR